jgi:RNA polymerase sigma factor (sigma-70 family)
MDPGQLFETSLSLIDKVIDGVCRRARLYGADAEDFASSVKLALVEDDYAVLRKYEGRASFATYLTIVVERLLSDARTHDRGRWHPSAEATRMGAAGLLLETLGRRDRRTLDEALPLLQSIDPKLGRADLETMLARLPERRPRPTAVDVDALPADTFAARETADAPLLASEARRLSERTAATVRETLATFDPEERALLKMRFVTGMSIADISRMTRLPQRPLYRRFEDLLARLRKALRLAGISVHDAGDVIAAAAELDFGLEKETNARSTLNEEMS